MSWCGILTRQHGRCGLREVGGIHSGPTGGMRSKIVIGVFVPPHPGSILRNPSSALAVRVRSPGSCADVHSLLMTSRRALERRRKRLYGEGLEEEVEDSSRASGGSAAARWTSSRAKRGKGKTGSNDKHPAFRPHKDLDMELEDWEIEDDIKVLNNITSTSSRGRRPPAKLANGIRTGRNGR